MAVNRSDRDKLYELLCERTGLPSGTDGDAVVAAYFGAWRVRAVAAGLPAGTPVPIIMEAEAKGRDVSRLSAALKAAAGLGSQSHAGGVRLLSAEEGQDALLLGGAQDDLTRRRVSATENYLGKSLRQALEDGDLR